MRIEQQKYDFEISGEIIDKPENDPVNRSNLILISVGKFPAACCGVVH